MKKIKTILLVDDDPASNYYNSYIIKESKIAHHIEVAENGRDALQIISKKTVSTTLATNFPDLIFLDINMPIMDGFEFLAEYEKLEALKNRNTQIFILTTSSHREDKKKASKFRSVRAFYTKPLTEEILNEVIKNYFS